MASRPTFRIRSRRKRWSTLDRSQTSKINSRNSSLNSQTRRDNWRNLFNSSKRFSIPRRRACKTNWNSNCRISKQRRATSSRRCKRRSKSTQRRRHRWGSRSKPCKSKLRNLRKHVTSWLTLRCNSKTRSSSWKKTYRCSRTSSRWRYQSIQGTRRSWSNRWSYNKQISLIRKPNWMKSSTRIFSITTKMSRSLRARFQRCSSKLVSSRSTWRSSSTPNRNLSSKWWTCNETLRPLRTSPDPKPKKTREMYKDSRTKWKRINNSTSPKKPNSARNSNRRSGSIRKPRRSSSYRSSSLKVKSSKWRNQSMIWELRTHSWARTTLSRGRRRDHWWRRKIDWPAQSRVFKGKLWLLRAISKNFSKNWKIRPWRSREMRGSTRICWDNNSSSSKARRPKWKARFKRIRSSSPKWNQNSTKNSHKSRNKTISSSPDCKSNATTISKLGRRSLTSNKNTIPLKWSATN